MQNFPYEVLAPETILGSVTITVRVPVPKDIQPTEVIHFIRSHALKQDLAANWVRKNAPNHGMETKGGPRPLLKDPQDRSSDILGYEQDYKLGQRV